MSGIGAIYIRNSLNTGCNNFQSDLIKLNNAMANHGQNGSGIWLGNQCGLVQQVTHYHGPSLVDNNPFYDPMHQISLVANCRLFNSDELKNQLGIPVSTDVHDNVLIFKSYLKWGANCADYLIGEFSILIWDKNKQQLIAIVDNFNTRPLYYYMDNQRVVFASSIKSLHSLSTIPRQLNFSKIARNDWLKFQAVLGETPFANINFIPAAHRLIISKETNLLHQYWQPELKDKLKFNSMQEFSEIFQEQFSKAIQATTNSHLPVCLQLSGGLDSSSIAMMYSKYNAGHAKHLICFSNILPSSHLEADSDERPYLDLLSSDNLIKNSIIDEWRGPFDSLELCFDNLYTSAQYYQHNAIQDAARRYNSKIILHGTLGELTSSYSGYEYLAELLYHGKWRELCKELVQYKKITSNSGYKILLSHALNPIRSRWFKKASSLSDNFKLISSSLIRPEFIQDAIPYAQLQHMTEQFLQTSKLDSIDARKNALTKLKWFIQHASHIFSQFTDDNKPGVYMSNPYFDKRFVDFCLQIPNQYRFKNGYPRSIIRLGMQNLLPEMISKRLSKTPFLPDYSARFHRQLPLAIEAINEIKSNSLVNQIIDINKLQQLMNISFATNTPDDNLSFLNFLVIPRTVYLAKFLSSF